MSFSKDSVKFTQNALANLVKVRRVSAFDLFAAIILSTPVDQGTLRGNWFVSLNADTSETTTATDGSGQATISAAQEITNRSGLGEDIVFTNNLPYAARIEFDGHSGKAPNGMVRVNTTRWKDIVTRNVRKLRSGL